MIVTVVAAISTPTMAAMTPILMAETNKVSNNKNQMHSYVHSKWTAIS